MRRVVVSGIGAVSSIGTGVREIASALCESRSRVTFNPEMQELGFRCQVYAPICNFSMRGSTGRLSLATQYAIAAAREAIADAQLESGDLASPRVGVILGTILGGINDANAIERRLLEHRAPQRSDATAVIKILNSSAASQVACDIGARGRVYSLNSACSTGPDAIGHAFELIAYGLQDVVVCGATEEDTWKQMGASYDNWTAMPTAYNDRPQQACRPFEANRSGFVLASGSGVLILEEYEAARKRDAQIYAEVVGYGSANDGADMVHPTGLGARRAVQQALQAAATAGVSSIDYVNPHGAGTPVGDAVEVAWIKDILADNMPLVSSTKALTGHAMGAAGALEAVYTLIMLRRGFIAPTLNLEEVAPDCDGVPHVREAVQCSIEAAMTVNVGLGGSNAAVVFRQL